MKATITYRLSETGRRAALAAGLPATEEQSIQIDVSVEDLGYFSIKSDGCLGSLSLADGAAIGPWGSGWASQYFDFPLTAEAVMCHIRQREVQREAALAKKRQSDENHRAAMQLEMCAVLSGADPKGYGLPAIKDDRICYRGLEFKASEISEVAAICAAHAAKRLEAKRLAEVESARAARHAEIEKMAPQPRVISATLSANGFTFVCPDSTVGEGWAKHLRVVDTAKQGGFAYDGPWMKCGSSYELPAGELLVVGGKAWIGSRKNGEWKHSLRVFCVTAAGVVPISNESRDGAASILALTPAERIEAVLSARIQKAERIQKRLADLPPSEDTEFIQSRLLAWKQVQTDCEKANLPVELPIASIEQAAQAIVAAGFRALAKTHHPDAGGTHKTMMLLTEARKQLADLLALAGAA